MGYIAEQQTTVYCNGMTLVEKNTFLDFPSEALESSRHRRSSAPELAWRSAFSAAQDLSASVVPDVSSEDEKQNSDAGVPEEARSEESCTLMMKNIPCSCKKEEILDLLHGLGFMESSNFFYLPTRKGKILGYAFIGFPQVEAAKRFRMTMTGYQMRQKKSDRVIDVLPASIQGLSNNWEYFKNTAVMQSQVGPIFRESQNEPQCI